MAHYAFVDDENVVVEVITGRDETDVVGDITDWETYYGQIRGLRCVRTSYNTWGNEHSQGGIPFRGNFAGVGFSYDEQLDVFIPPQPFPSWILNQDTFQWEPPVAQPAGGISQWDEDLLEWVNV